MTRFSWGLPSTTLRLASLNCSSDANSCIDWLVNLSAHRLLFWLVMAVVLEGGRARFTFGLVKAATATSLSATASSSSAIALARSLVKV